MTEGQSLNISTQAISDPYQILDNSKYCEHNALQCPGKLTDFCIKIACWCFLPHSVGMWLTGGVCSLIIIIIITKSLKKNLETIPGKHSIDSLQKTAILGTSHTIRKVLQCEAWSVSGGDHCWFKRSTEKKCLWQRHRYRIIMMMMMIIIIIIIIIIPCTGYYPDQDIDPVMVKNYVREKKGQIPDEVQDRRQWHVGWEGSVNVRLSSSSSSSSSSPLSISSWPQQKSFPRHDINNFDVSLTVHLSIILVMNQLSAQNIVL